MRNRNYTTELSQGAGMINETLCLLPIYREGMTWKELLDKAVIEGVLPSNTERRLSNLVNKVFNNRFMKRNPKVPTWLLRIREKGLSLNQFTQLLMVYCAREHAVLYETITEILNPLKSQQEPKLKKSRINDFVNQLSANRQQPWSEGMCKKNAGYINSTLADFNFIKRDGSILPYDLYDFTLLYLMHEAHFEGLSDMAIWNLEDWSLFNLSRQDVLSRIMSLSLKGAFMAQTSGELLNISWTFKSMEDFIDATV